MELDMVANMEVDKMVDMVAGHGCWLDSNFFDPKLTRLALLRFASL